MPRRHAEAPPPVRDTASLDWMAALKGTGTFDLASEPQNPKGWEIFELGQKQFWDVPTAISWDAPVREDPEYAESIAAMLAFLCPGEKAAVTGASLVSTGVKSEEAKFYFALQALEEAKHYDGMRRLIPKITGRPMEPVKPAVRALFTYGVVDRDDIAFMMGNINIIGEHLANQIFVRIKAVATDESVKQLLFLIGRDESRHIAAGHKFYGEVYDQYRKHRRRILAKNMTVVMLLAIAAYDLVNPMKKLKIDLSDILMKMYSHYEDVVGSYPAFPEQAALDAVLTLLRKSTPNGVRTISAMTDEGGHLSFGKMLHAAEEALSSPRALRRVFAG